MLLQIRSLREMSLVCDLEIVAMLNGQVGAGARQKMYDYKNITY